jgi:hypothetical protein
MEEYIVLRLASFLAEANKATSGGAPPCQGYFYPAQNPTNPTGYPCRVFAGRVPRPMSRQNPAVVVRLRAKKDYAYATLIYYSHQ